MVNHTASMTCQQPENTLESCAKNGQELKQAYVVLMGSRKDAGIHIEVSIECYLGEGLKQ